MPPNFYHILSKLLTVKPYISITFLFRTKDCIKNSKVDQPCMCIL